jgi:hypothetical protein
VITIGTRYYPAAADSEERQRRSRESLLALDGVQRVNLQFRDEAFRPEGFDTRAVLRRDSRTVTGAAAGARKPIVSEMFDALADAASARGDRYFAYLNADIEVAPAAIDRIISHDCEGYAFCRVDLAPGTRQPQSVLLLGLDMFAVRVEWWGRWRRRFRPYIAGEALWDNVYAAVLGSHARAQIVDDVAAIFHELHPQQWNDGPFAEYNGYLAALDAPYFSRWARYAAGLQAGRAGGALDRDRLTRETFDGPVLRPTEYPRHAARALRAWTRYSLRRARTP